MTEISPQFIPWELSAFCLRITASEHSSVTAGYMYYQNGLLEGHVLFRNHGKFAF